jgi:hypothetical protein
MMTEKNATKRSVTLMLPSRISFAAYQKLSLRHHRTSQPNNQLHSNAIHVITSVLRAKRIVLNTATSSSTLPC